MVTYTAAKNLALVANSSYVGTWDVPTNSNWSIVDDSLGGQTTIALTNAPVVLSAAQYQCATMFLTGAISANIAITFPAVGSYYTVFNLTSNTSAFTITLQTTVAGGRSIGLPPADPTDIMTDGTNVRFHNLSHVGTYWDYAGSSVPAWVSACTIPPYLNCDGTSFSSATYPILATILGGTTLPDARGRARSVLNQTTSRLLSTKNGVDGETLLAGGGGTTTLSSINLPNTSFPVTDPGHTHIERVDNGGSGTTSIGPAQVTMFVNATLSGTVPTGSGTTGITVASGGSGTAVQLATPTYIGGLTLIRAA